MVNDTAPRRTTVEDYLAMDRSSADVKYEYYDGYVVVMAGGTPQHGEICGHMITALNVGLEGTTCRVYTSDMRVKLSPAYYVYPDVSVSCAEADRTSLDGIATPRLVVEVLSPSTINTDRGRKFRQYRACQSIEEYVMIYTSQPLIEVFRRCGRFLTYFDYVFDDILELTSIGVRIPVARIYRGIEFPPDEDQL